MSPQCVTLVFIFDKNDSNLHPNLDHAQQALDHLARQPIFEVARILAIILVQRICNKNTRL